MSVKIGLIGAKGRMGEWILRLLRTDYAARATVHAAVDRGDDLSTLSDCDVVIDFSSPEAVSALGKKKLPPIVVGSTGWNAEQQKALLAIAEKTTVLQSSNFSTGVLMLQQILKLYSPFLKSLGFTPSIVETHHQHKKDAPSGTAILLQKAIAPEAPDSVQTHAVRAGEVIGDHEVTFFGAAETISIKHHAMDRSIFARGAIEAALWLAQRKPAPGMISMEDYFNDAFAAMRRR